VDKRQRRSTKVAGLEVVGKRQPHQATSRAASLKVAGLEVVGKRHPHQATSRGASLVAWRRMRPALVQALVQVLGQQLPRVQRRAHQEPSSSNSLGGVAVILLEAALVEVVLLAMASLASSFIAFRCRWESQLHTP
jgi:hypothetical protein